MSRSERIRTLGGPGGLRCPCCGGSPDTTHGKRQRRILVRIHRRRDKARAIREGMTDISPG